MDFEIAMAGTSVVVQVEEGPTLRSGGVDRQRMCLLLSENNPMLLLFEEVVERVVGMAVLGQVLPALLISMARIAL